MSVALATIDDLEVVLGSAPADPSRANRLIEMASAAVERWCGRAFTYVEDDSMQVKVGRTGLLVIPSPPIVDVTSVTDVNGDVVDSDAWEIHGDHLERTTGAWTPGLYTVVASHGFDPIPDDVAEVVCTLVAGRLSSVSLGLSSESLGDWSASTSVPFGTAAGDQQILASLRYYKRLIGRIEVLT